MQPLCQYIAGRAETVPLPELDAIIDRYPWFTPARRARALLTDTLQNEVHRGKAERRHDPALVLPLLFSPTVPPLFFSPTVPPLLSSPRPDHTPDGSPDPANATSEGLGLIDRFLQHGNYKIVPADDTEDIPPAAQETDPGFDPELATEELAEIYRAQGLTDEAEKIYRALGLTPSAR
jgi:hypothetical protein